MLRVLAALGLLVVALLAPPALSSGDVAIGWIARTPRLDYVRDAADPTRQGWPAPGQVVTWEAHLESWFDADLPAVGYRWLLDGVEVRRGHVAIAAGARAVVGFPWEWRFERHELTFELDPDRLLSEEEEENNSLTVFTDALSVGFYVEKSEYDLFRAKQHLLAGAHSTSWEDWAQRQIRRLDEMARSAVYPETPAGVLDRFRIDEIVVVPDGALPLVPLPNAGQFAGQPNASTEPNTDDRSVDLIWGFTAAEVPFLTDFTTTNESNPFFLNGTLLHELGHARYLVDVYGWWVRSGADGDRVDIREGGVPVFGSALMPASGSFAHFSTEQGLMNQTYGFIDRYSAAALNLIAGRRATRGNYNEPENIGAFLNDLPKENRVTVRHPDGSVAANADVWVYQAVGGSPSYFSKIYDDVPDLKLRTDADGRVLVGRCPFAADGRVVHTFGASNVTAIVRVAEGSVVSYGFLESLGFNLAYWRGETELAEHELVVGAPVCLRNGPVLTAPRFGSIASSPVTLAWAPAAGITDYEVWASENGGPARLLATLDGTTSSYTAALSGAVTWWIVMNTGSCPKVRSGLGFFTAGAAPSTASASFFVPVVLSIHGAAGSFYTSELTLTNRGASAARAVVRYTDSAGGGGVTEELVPPGRQIVIPDEVARLAGRGVVPPGPEHVGTLRVTFEGLSDPAAAAVTVRTGTPVEGGRAGLGYPGVPVARLLDGPSAVCGLRNDEQDRANLAVQNAGLPSEGPITLRLTAVSAGGQETRLAEETLAPGGFFQLGNALAALPPGASAWVRVERAAGSAPYFAYGVLNDRVTSDGSFVPAVAVDAHAASEWTLPAVVETPVFSTELVLANLVPRARSLRATLTAQGAEVPASLDISLARDEQLLVQELVQRLRESSPSALGPAGATVAGALSIADRNGDTAPLFAAGRVSSAGAGGRLGLFETATPKGAAPADTAWIYGLRQDGENRTNVAFVNTGEVDASTDVFDLDVFDGDSGLLARTVPGVAAAGPRGFSQIDALLSRLTPGVSNAYVRVRRASGANPFLTYAVVNDGAAPGERSGDGAFIPGIP